MMVHRSILVEVIIRRVTVLKLEVLLGRMVRVGFAFPREDALKEGDAAQWSPDGSQG